MILSGCSVIITIQKGGLETIGFQSKEACQFGIDFNVVEVEDVGNIISNFL